MRPAAIGVDGSRAASLWAGLQLVRPANVVTAWADILVGAAVAFSQSNTGMPLQALPWLLLATTGLYAGGVALNDVMDAETDARERPERPIPSGRISRALGLRLAAALLAMGVLFAGLASWPSLIVAVVTVLAILSYDALAKGRPLLGPLNMGLCRAGNLLLGVSILPGLLFSCWPLGLIPVLYIGAITLISQGEVHGGSRRDGVVALGLLAAVMLVILAIGARAGNGWAAAVIMTLFGWRVLPPFQSAARHPEPLYIRRAVKAGVLSLIILDAAIATSFAGLPYGLMVLMLWPISHALARMFAVT